MTLCYLITDFFYRGQQKTIFFIYFFLTDNNALIKEQPYSSDKEKISHVYKLIPLLAEVA